MKPIGRPVVRRQQQLQLFFPIINKRRRRRRKQKTSLLLFGECSSRRQCEWASSQLYSITVLWSLWAPNSCHHSVLFPYDSSSISLASHRVASAQQHNKNIIMQRTERTLLYKAQWCSDTSNNKWTRYKREQRNKKERKSTTMMTMMMEGWP